MVHCIAAVSAQSLDDDRAARGRPWDLDQSRLDRRHPGNSHQTSLPTGGPHSSSRWRFSGLMPATSCSNLYRRRRHFGLAISTTSLPSRTSMLAALPTLAPISCANALGIRSARLLPHFRNSIFTIRITPGKYLQCRYATATRQVLRPSGKINRRFGESRTVTETKAASSLLRSAPIQRLERKQNATGLAPKRGFIAAQPIEREIRQIG